MYFIYLQIFLKKKLRQLFTSIAAFLQVMSQLSFCLIPIAEGSSAGHIILFFVVRHKDFLVTSYQILQGVKKQFS